jgi:ATP-dependent DNA helicase RecQ
LTAILPPRDEAEFMEIIKVDVLTEHVFCTATSRPNIEYYRFEYKGDKEEAIYRIV